LTNSVSTDTVESSKEGIPFPSHFNKTQFTIAAFDNFDHDEATLSSIGGSHDIVTVLFQDDLSTHVAKPMLKTVSIPSIILDHARCFGVIVVASLYFT
jgi:hypothetical protein